MGRPGRSVRRQRLPNACWRSSIGVAAAGGTPYLTTSRRTPARSIEALRARLPASARLFRWTPDAADNPYLGLLGLADGFVVTGDSISMLVEIAACEKPLAILELPCGWLGRFDMLRRRWIRQMFDPERAGGSAPPRRRDDAVRASA